MKGLLMTSKYASSSRLKTQEQIIENLQELNQAIVTDNQEKPVAYREFISRCAWIR
ncbi:MAG: hypothetical protein WCJ93_01920 [Methanomicrobiales archaeon]